MPARIGIELAPSVCRIVELDAPLGRTRHGVTLPRVRSFSALPASDRGALDAFKALRNRRRADARWAPVAPPSPAPRPNAAEPARATQQTFTAERPEPPPASAPPDAIPQSAAALRSSNLSETAPPSPLGPRQAMKSAVYGPERLAIVDGRIVGEGDEIRGARIVEITESAVLLRDAQGRLRRLAGGK